MYLLIHLPSIHLSILIHLFIYPSSIYPSMHHPSISISTSIYPCSIHLSILVHLFIYALSIYPLVCLFIYASSIYPLVHLFIYPSSIYPCISISTSIYLCIIHLPIVLKQLVHMITLHGDKHPFITSLLLHSNCVDLPFLLHLPKEEEEE